MKNTLLLILTVGILGFAYLYLTDNPILRDYIIPPPPAPEPTPVPLTPEQQLHSLFQNPIITASQLAALCNKFPEVAQQVYANRLMTISGEIYDFTVSGVNSDRATIILTDNLDRKVALSFDLNKYNIADLSPRNRDKGKYMIIGNELHYISLNGKARLKLYERGQMLKQKARFERVYPAAIVLEAQQ